MPNERQVSLALPSDLPSLRTGLQAAAVLPMRDLLALAAVHPKQHSVVLAVAERPSRNLVEQALLPHPILSLVGLLGSVVRPRRRLVWLGQLRLPRSRLPIQSLALVGSALRPKSRRPRLRPKRHLVSLPTLGFPMNRPQKARPIRNPAVQPVLLPVLPMNRLHRPNLDPVAVLGFARPRHRPV